MKDLNQYFEFLKERYQIYKSDNEEINDFDLFFKKYQNYDHYEASIKLKLHPEFKYVTPLSNTDNLVETFKLIRDVLNPIISIQDDDFIVPEIWKTQISSFKNKYKGVIPSVGRIESLDNKNIATGWFITKDIIVTNSHVYKLIDRKNPKIKIRIDLKEENQQSTKPVEIAIDKVKYFERDENPDIAFFKVKSNEYHITPLKLADSFNYEPNTVVALIGYPSYKDTFGIEEVFIDPSSYDKKHFQPGMIRANNSTIFEHDCSTLGGNSGSPVFDLTNGKVIGLHFGESGSLFNGAVKASEIVRLARAKKILP